MSHWIKQNFIAFQDEVLKGYVEREEKAFSALQWSEKAIPLSQLVEQYLLPQIVRIEDGYYSQEEDSSLSSGQILKIHCMKTVQKVSGVDHYGGDIYVPLNTATKVVLRPENFGDVYETVCDLAHAKPLPRFVEVTRGYYNPSGLKNDSMHDLTVDPGEVLEVIGNVDNQLFVRPGKERYMIFKNATGNEFKLPFNCSPCFKPLLGKDHRVLGEVVCERKLPIYVSFVDLKTSSNSHAPDSLDNEMSKFGVIKLKEIFNEDLVVASCGHQSVRVIFTIPKVIDVTVKVALGALTNDPEYAGLCQGYNNYRRIEELTIKRHEQDILRRSGEVRGYEYYLRSALEGAFVGMDESVVPGNEEGQEEDSENEYVESDFVKKLKKAVKEKKKTATLPYEVTDIHVHDFREGGKYADHVSHDSESSLKYSYDLHKDASDSDEDYVPVRLVGVKPLNTLRSISNDDISRPIDELKPFATEQKSTAESNEHEYLVSMQQSVSVKQSNETLSIPSRTPAKRSNSAPPETAIDQTFPVYDNRGGVANLPSKLHDGRGTKAEDGPFSIPDDLSKLSTAEICSCLKILHLGHLVEIFIENQVNGDLLMSLEEEDYKDLKLSNFERKKVMRFVKGWRPDKS